MSHSHAEVLRQLMPVELSGVHEQDLAIEGKHLDEALDRATTLLEQIFPDTADELIPAWERLCGITPGADDTLQLRRTRVVAKLKEQGRLDRQYYIDIAAALGVEITIEELGPGDEGYGPEGIFVWRVTAIDLDHEIIYFRAGESVAGDYLMTWRYVIDIEEIIERLKPAHTLCLYAHASYWPLLWPFNDGLSEENRGLEPSPGAVVTLKPGGHTGGCAAFQPGTENLMTTAELPWTALDFSDWTAATGVDVTITQGQEDPDGGTGGTRIQTSGGSAIQKYYSCWFDTTPDLAYSTQVWVKCLSGSLVVFNNYDVPDTLVVPADGWVRATFSVVSRLGLQLVIQFRTEQAADSLDFLAYHPQIERRPCCTDFTPSTRPASLLEYVIGGDTPRAIPAQGTIRMRLKFLLDAADFPARQTILDWSDGEEAFQIYTVDDSLEVCLGKFLGFTICQVSGLSYLKDVWYNIAFTWDYATGQAVIHAGGVSGISADNNARIVPQPAPLRLGQSKNGLNPLYASIDDLQIEDVVRTSLELEDWLAS